MPEGCSPIGTLTRSLHYLRSSTRMLDFVLFTEQSDPLRTVMEVQLGALDHNFWRQSRCMPSSKGISPARWAEQMNMSTAVVLPSHAVSCQFQDGKWSLLGSRCNAECCQIMMYVVRCTYINSLPDLHALQECIPAISCMAWLPTFSCACQQLSLLEKHAEQNVFLVQGTDVARAECSGYTMEGTKKLGIDAKRRKKLLAAVREKAVKPS